MKKSYLFTSESVSKGHPDKVCDQISDAILDAFLDQDKHSRVACETMVTTGQVIVVGEVRSDGYVHLDKVVRKAIEEIGYVHAGQGFHYNDCGILNYIHSQSPDIAQGVDKEGAGDQGIMFGYACDETKQYMPATIQYSHEILKLLQKLKKEGETWIYPDAKSQVTIEYEDDRPLRVRDVVLSVHHRAGESQKKIRDFAINEVFKKVIPKELLDKGEVNYFVNPTGKFEIGGPKGDSGVTGRKIIVDTYGGWGAHGGGAFSGKDPSKVDRSASYMARYLAKNVVASGTASRCLIQLAYVIGVAEPVSIFVNTYGTGEVSDEKIADAIMREVDCSPSGIIKRFNLLRPIYYQTASYGHFGRDDLHLPWEELDLKGLFKAL